MDSKATLGPIEAGTEPQGRPQARACLLGDWRFRLAMVILVALIPRMVYLAQIDNWQFFHWPVLDSRTQWKWATILLQTHLVGNAEVLAKAPLYPYYLAFANWLMGEREAGLFVAHMGQLVAGAVTCGLTYLLGRRVFGEAVGLIAGLTLAVYSPGIYRDGQLLDTALATFLATVFLLLLLAALDRPTRARWLAAGLALGLLSLTRPNLVFLALVSLVMLAVWLGRTQRRATWGLAGALVLGVVLPILPMTGRNYLIVRRFVPISLTGGVNLYTGNRPGADGYSPIPSGIAWARTWHEAARHGAMGPVQQDEYWRGEAMRAIREDPGRALKLFIRKLYLYWNAFEIPNNVSYDWGREHSSLLRAMPLTFAVAGPLALLGLVLGGWRNRAAWVMAVFVLVQMAAVAVFFVTGRYRMPAMPALCVFAGFAVVELGRMVRAKRAGTAALSLAALALFAVLVNSDRSHLRVRNPANRDWYYLGQSYVMGNDLERAKEAFRQATKQHPEDADAYSLLGLAEAQTGEVEAAARDLKQALAIAPDYATPATNLGGLALQEGWPLEEPARLLREATRRSAGEVEGLAMLVRLNVRGGERKEAEANLRELEGALKRLSRADTRAGPMLAAARTAVAEAQEAGLALPPMLQPPPDTGWGQGRP